MVTGNRQEDQGQIETLVTNGLGGYSLCALGDKSFRKYHGLYTISRKPPVDRVHTLSYFEIEIKEGAGDWQPVTNQANQAHANYKHSATYWPLVEEKCEAAGGTFSYSRTRAFKRHTHTLALRYEFSLSAPSQIRLTPVFNMRDHHDTQAIKEEAYSFSHQSEYKQVVLYHELATVTMVSSMPFVPKCMTTENAFYDIEEERGYPAIENYFSPGFYEMAFEKGRHTLDFLIDNQVAMDSGVLAERSANISEVIDSIFETERNRLLNYADHATLLSPEFLPLVGAADHFIVKRDTTQKSSILAGYPWFTDWGRDTMIAIPGLCLTTGRSQEALEMIETFIAHQKGGIIPNNFPDAGEEPMYNTADATLWLFQGVYAYVMATQNTSAVQGLMPDLERMLQHHIEGTLNDIFVDVDGLLSTGNATTQLTWMDVKVKDWVVTPRHGKAIEINALYYNALNVMAYLKRCFGDIEQAQAYEERAIYLKRVFNEKFWNKQSNRPYDLIIDEVGFDMIRPNMIFAISLPFEILNEEHWQAVVDLATEHLYFDYGLRSLSPGDAEYHGVYKGDLLARDGAYHRGTGWGWLIGPYLEAHYKTFKDPNFVKDALLKTLPHIGSGCLGSFAENFDGDAPHMPRGCCAQAWSVAEVLRLSTLIKASSPI